MDQDRRGTYLTNIMIKYIFLMNKKICCFRAKPGKRLMALFCDWPYVTYKNLSNCLKWFQKTQKHLKYFKDVGVPSYWWSKFLRLKFPPKKCQQKAYLPRGRVSSEEGERALEPRVDLVQSQLAVRRFDDGLNQPVNPLLLLLKTLWIPKRDSNSRPIPDTTIRPLWAAAKCTSLNKRNDLRHQNVS
jgi:hypothetical protein